MVSTELTVVVTDAAGASKTLDSHAPDPGDRPRGIQFGSQLGSGWYVGSFTLSRAIDAEHNDLHLGDDVRIMLANGDTVYEGWISAMPRSMDTEHSLTINLSGYMAHTADEPFSAIFVDRDLSRWGEVSIAQRVALMGASWNPDGGNLTIAPDATGYPGLVSSRPGVLNKPINRFVYDAGPGNLIGRLYVGTQALAVLSSADPALEVFALFWNDDNGADQVSSGDVKASVSLSQDISATPRRYAVMDWRYNNTAGGSDGTDYGVRWQNVAVFGDHGLPLVGDAPGGVAASDVIRYLIGRYCPHLNTAGVMDTTYPIGHLVFDESTVYDAMLKVNSFHLWDLAVWEDRTLHFKQTDLSDHTWEVRHDEVGNQIGLQGDDFSGLVSGVQVRFTDVATGAQSRLHPDDYPDLRDASIDNPANVHGRRMYPVFSIPFPTTEANALELGRLKLIELSRPKAPGSFTVTGRIKDRSGQWQSPSMIRSGDTIRLVSSVTLSDVPRLIGEVTYSHDGQSATVSVDGTRNVIEALLDRTTTALTAAGLS